jgi:hypothetical protein
MAPRIATGLLSALIGGQATSSGLSLSRAGICSLLPLCGIGLQILSVSFHSGRHPSSPLAKSGKKLNLSNDTAKSFSIAYWVFAMCQCNKIFCDFIFHIKSI